MKQESIESIQPSSIRQEFYCRVSGGGCGGYITVKLNMALEGRIKVICPKCKHEHERTLKGGRIVDDHGRGKPVVQELLPTLAAWHDKPQACVIFKPATTEFENGNSVILDNQMRESWFEKFGKIL